MKNHSLIPSDAVAHVNQLLDIYEKVDEYSDALKAAFSDEMKNCLQVSMQEKMEASSGLVGGLSDIKLVNLSFNIGNSITAVRGTWKFSRNSEQIKRIYGDGSVNKRTQVGFNMNGVEIMSFEGSCP